MPTELPGSTGTCTVQVYHVKIQHYFDNYYYYCKKLYSTQILGTERYALRRTCYIHEKTFSFMKDRVQRELSHEQPCERHHGAPTSYQGDIRVLFWYAILLKYNVQDIVYKANPEGGNSLFHYSFSGICCYVCTSNTVLSPHDLNTSCITKYILLLLCNTVPPVVRDFWGVISKRGKLDTHRGERGLVTLAACYTLVCHIYHLTLTTWYKVGSTGTEKYTTKQYTSTVCSAKIYRPSFCFSS